MEHTFIVAIKGKSGGIGIYSTHYTYQKAKEYAEAYNKNKANKLRGKAFIYKQIRWYKP